MSLAQDGAKCPGVSNWNTDQTVGNSDYVQVWASTENPTKPQAFHKAVFQINTDKMHMRVTIDGVIKLQVDLEEIDGNFKLKNNEHSLFSITKYANPNLWLYCPSVPMNMAAGEQMVIELKAKTGNKKLVRGMSEWGAR